MDSIVLPGMGLDVLCNITSLPIGFVSPNMPEFWWRKTETVVHHFKLSESH